MAVLIDGSLGVDKIKDGTIVDADINSSATIVNVAGTEGFVAAYSAAAAATWLIPTNGDILAMNDDSSGDKYDEGSNYDTSTYKYTAPSTGTYVFWASIYTGNSDTASGFEFQLNNADLDYMLGVTYHILYRDTDANDAVVHGNLQVKMTAGQTMHIGANRTSDVYTGHCAWGGYRLS
jgi:hypothetical protein